MLMATLPLGTLSVSSGSLRAHGRTCGNSNCPTCAHTNRGSVTGWGRAGKESRQVTWDSGGPSPLGSTSRLWLFSQTCSCRPLATKPRLPGPTHHQSPSGQRKRRETSWAQGKEMLPLGIHTLKCGNEGVTSPQGPGNQLQALGIPVLCIYSVFSPPSSLLGCFTILRKQ